MIPLESWPDSSALGLMRVAGPIGSEGRLRFLILREGRFSPGLEIGGGTSGSAADLRCLPSTIMGLAPPFELLIVDGGSPGVPLTFGGVTLYPANMFSGVTLALIGVFEGCPAIF